MQALGGKEEIRKRGSDAGPGENFLRNQAQNAAVAAPRGPVNDRIELAADNSLTWAKTQKGRFSRAPPAPAMPQQLQEADLAAEA